MAAAASAAQAATQAVQAAQGAAANAAANGGAAPGGGVFGLLPVLLLNAMNQGKPYCPAYDWTTRSPVSKFAMGPCLGVSGIGTIETPQKTVYVIDRTDYHNTYMKLPSGYWAFAEEVRLSDNRQRPLDVKSNTFCSSGQFLPDGSFISVGGYPNTKQGYEPGPFSIRRIMPGSDFTIVANMSSARWYPTTQILPDGRMVIIGGSINGVGVNTMALNNPTLEYYPKRPGETQFDVPFLIDSMPYNLYPFVHLLPSGRLFLFAKNVWTLYDTATNLQVGKTQVRPGNLSIVHSYPLSATSCMFQLSPLDGYKAEIQICGGAPKQNKLADGYMNGQVFGPAWSYCHRVRPEDPVPYWQVEKMKFARVMPQAVLIPDGTVLIFNGAQTGFAGVPNFVSAPVYQPEEYNPLTHSFTGRPLAVSHFPRLYHASAFLAHDGTVFVSGGNPNQGISLNNGIASTNFATEFFYPPYLAGGYYPDILWAPPKIAVGPTETFLIDVACEWCPKVNNTLMFSVVMAFPGFSTHGANQGMRNVELPVLRAIYSGVFFKLLVRAPPNKNIAPPHWYWLFVLARGKPNRNGQLIWVANM